MEVRELTPERKKELIGFAIRGANRLDHAGLAMEWAKEINLSELNMYSLWECVLGQVFGNYGDGMSELGISLDEGYLFGFDGREVQDYDVLHNAWAGLIAVRLGDDGSADFTQFMH